MAQIKHCSAFRRTQVFWLNSNDPHYKYQVLQSTTCPKCGQFVMEWIGIFADGKHSPAKRIAVKNHEEWIHRTDLVAGDIAEGLDSSQWESVRAGVYWVYGSMPTYPYLYGRRRVQ
jgi:hypothetical protein